MKDPTKARNNRTGIATAPERAREMIQNVDELTPQGQPEGAHLDALRGEYVQESPPAGTMPEAGSEEAAVLLDALGARLQYEHTGTRVYEALLTKVRTLGPVNGGPTEAELSEIWKDELAHFQLLQTAIESLDGDPTAVTPSANVQAVSSTGLLQVVTDPRMGQYESLQALLAVELTDRDSWQHLINVAESLGQTELAERFTECLATEEQHLTRVRNWLAAIVRTA